MKLVQSKDNPHFKMLFRLAASQRERHLTSMTLLDGNNLISAYRDAGQSAFMIAIGETAYSDSGQRELFEAVPADVHLMLADRLLNAVSQVVTTSGLVSAIRIPKPESWPESPGTCILLEGIQDPGNLGTIFRTAVAAGVHHVALSPESVSAWNPKVLRAGMGAHFRLNIHENLDLVATAKSFPGKVIATMPRAKATVYTADLRQSVAWLFGNEGAGLSSALMNCAIEQLSIPMHGPAESLNVAGAAAICLFEQLRQLKFRTTGDNSE